MTGNSFSDPKNFLPYKMFVNNNVYCPVQDYGKDTMSLLKKKNVRERRVRKQFDQYSIIGI